MILSYVNLFMAVVIAILCFGLILNIYKIRRGAGRVIIITLFVIIGVLSLELCFAIPPVFVTVTMVPTAAFLGWLNYKVITN